MNAAAPFRPLLAPVDAFDIADRVIAGGAYARMSSLEQLSLCVWVADRRPKDGRTYEVTIVARRDVKLAIEEQAGRVARARDAAEFILAHGHAGLPADIEDAIAGVLDAQKRASNRDLGAVAGAGARLELRTAIDLLRTTFEKDAANGQR